MSETKTNPKELSVLVVDDEVILCQSVEKVLKRKGHKVDTVTSVAEALKILDAGNTYDLVIADLMMPQAGGMELLSAVQGSWPDLPVLIITGFSSISTAVETTKLGAAGYLPKPFTPDELEKAVDAVFFRVASKKAAAEVESNEIIDVDMPFNAKEIEKATSPRCRAVDAVGYADRRSQADSAGRFLHARPALLQEIYEEGDVPAG